MRQSRSSRRRSRRFAAFRFVAALAAVLASGRAAPLAAQPQEALGQQGQVWNLGTQQSGRVFSTELTVFNQSCRGAHDFALSIDGVATRFLSITGPTELTGIRRGESQATPARLDLTGVEPGIYDGGRVVVRCLDCPPNCNLDYQYIRILLTVVAPPGTSGTESPPAAPGTPAPATAEADPDGDCEFLPKVVVDWEAGATGEGGAAGPGATIGERDGAHVVDLGPGSPLATAGVTLSPALATQARELCLATLDPCAELLAKVRAAEVEARLAQARADAATANEVHDRADAAAIDESIAADRAQIAILRRQAGEWRELAAAARAQAALNRERAQRQPEYAASWLREAAIDEARAAQRDGYAQRLEDEAARLEARIRDRAERADATRGRAEAARQAAAAAAEALALARAEYEACLERQRLECERLRREAVLAAARAAAATSSGPATTARPTGGGTAPPAPPRSAYPTHASLPVKTSPFCKWVRFDVPFGATATNVRVVATTARDTPGALEVRPMESGTRTSGRGFDYHCKAKSGTALILFEVVAGDIQRYKMRIGCTEE